MKILFHLSGFPESDYDRLLSEIEAWKLMDEKFMPFLKLPVEKELNAVNSVVEKLRNKAETLVVVGIGGSSRGAKAVHEAIGKGKNSLLFLDNIDTDLIHKLLNELEWEKSAFAFISKSGKTLETVTILNLILHELEKRNLNPEENCVFISNRGTPFEKLANEFKAQFIQTPPTIDGRFSIFTPVGLLPLSFAGYELSLFLDGAFDVVDSPLPAFNLAACKYLHYREGRRISVAMPYSSFMTEFTEWYVQLWGESLGKEGKGQTPLKALGTSSQHAILQLFIDGPDDKFYQLFFVNSRPSNIKLPEKTFILPLLSGKTVQDIMRAEFEGTVYALSRKNRPLVLFELSKLSEYQMGYLFMTYMIATVVMAKLLGVNPYGQPAVEIGKRITLEKLSET